MAASINEILAQTPTGGTVTLPTGEFEGPIYINRPMRVIGSNTTIWAKRGNVVEVSVAGASLENLRLELTNGRMNDYAVAASQPVAINDVEIFGACRGFGAEDIRFEIPRTIDLGRFAADETNTFTIRMTVPVAASIDCQTTGLTFSPSQLEPGDNIVTITVSGMSPMYYLFAEVLVRSRFTRRIFVTGKPCANIAPVLRKELPSEYYCAVSAAEEATSLQIETKNEYDAPTELVQPQQQTNVRPIYVPPQELPLLEIRKGQRISLLPYVGSSFDINFYCRKPARLEIDPYIFLLDETGRSFDNRCLVFFGNNSSPDGSVTYHPTDGHISIELNKIEQRVSKIMVVYSIYGANAGMNFASVAAPNLRLSSLGRDRIIYSMYNLGNAPTVIASEFYRYNGEWKVSAIGWGFQEGLARLCNNYGINTN